MTTESVALEATMIHPATPLPHRIIRVVQVLLERGRYSWMWVVPKCPYCGKPHDHYGGPSTMPPLVCWAAVPSPLRSCRGALVHSGRAAYHPN